MLSLIVSQSRRSVKRAAPSRETAFENDPAAVNECSTPMPFLSRLNRVLPLGLALLLSPPAAWGQAPGATPLAPPAVPHLRSPDMEDAGPSLPPPTDQPPPEVPLPDPIPLGRGFLVNGALDLRTRMADTGRRDGLWVNAAELDLQHRLSRKGEARGNVYVQILAEDPPDVARGRDIQIGEAYVLYRLPVAADFDSTAYLKAGQFQIPFGLLAVYDPHLMILQPLYAQSLGLRTDFGLALSGRLYGYLNYDFALTTGTGPNHLDVNPNRVVTFRLGRTFTTRNGVVNVGGSLLQGRLPITDLTAENPFAVELPPSGRVRADRGGFVSKSRIAGDGSYGFRRTTARGEFVVGADNDQRILGYYVEGDYRFTGRISAAVSRSLFVYPVGNSSASRESLGLTYASSANLTFRGLYQYLRDVPRDMGGRVRHRLTFQVLLRF